MRTEEKKETNQMTLSLHDLGKRIQEREARIDAECMHALRHATNAVKLALEQGADLLLAKHHSKHGEWGEWLAKYFPKSVQTAAGYMRIAQANLNHAFDFEDVKSVREAFRLLNLIPENTPSQVELIPSIAVAPILSKLTFVAEWVTKYKSDVAKWDQIQRDELKAQLKPAVELYEAL